MENFKNEGPPFKNLIRPIRFGESFAYEIDGKKGKSSPLEVFTHVMTHEYHHKGQLLSLSRQLGYTPIDTDVIR
jgi:uncharacterized damage-inducible protein DinB